MTEGLLAGLRVVDLAGEPAQMAARILGDLGADVRLFDHPGRGRDIDRLAWDAGKTAVDESSLRSVLAEADVVLDTPGWPGAPELDPSLAPRAVWVSVTPFGLDGPRSGWRASDLGVMAASGNMYATGDPDRAPVRCTEPSAWCHAGPEAAFAALTALASGVRPQRVDVSMQEVVLVANMGAGGRFARAGFRGRRTGAAIGRTREIWPCADGYVSFGLRGGKARVPNLQTITRLVEEAGLDSPALSERDWTTYNHLAISDEELREIEAPIARYFEQRTMAELYEVACETNLMLAPANSPKELYASAQLASRSFFGPFAGVERFPLSFARVTSTDGAAAPARPRVLGERSEPATPEAEGWPVGRGPVGGAPRSGEGPTGRDPEGQDPGAAGGATRGAWSGTRILEFGSGAAGPIATRYFAEHGATVLRVESKTRPDFLRVYAMADKSNTHGLEGSDMFDALNVGKLSLTLKT
ncbi:MAG: hypothetical protein E6G17_07945 [Actinobacteria bacterium]|nr:MAG: hypothetical protein E6G17_07945 [Actinomycetota bacterium]